MKKSLRAIFSGIPCTTAHGPDFEATLKIHTKFNFDQN